ncbi:hypothetical protein [Nostoc sp. 2RC]|uniref:hypothetical protein n=1 Tax=Nostoc sp. 2RC TaxID=2485484 RepID=UPI002892E14C|nr:hypothetical protein [Nostoc sp. 2RC]
MLGINHNAPSRTFGAALGNNTPVICTTAMERIMITEEDLAQQFSVIIEHTHPRVWELLRQCYVKVINPRPYLTRANIKTCIRYGKYIGIYCPNRLINAIAAEKNLLTEVAEYMGLVEVVCINANSLLHDPLSNLKEAYPRLWLDLLWIVTQEH